MAGYSGGVLKKGQVRPGGARAAGVPAAIQPASAQSQVKVVERDDRSATIEVCCACGRRTYIQCRWPNPAAPGAGQV